MTTYTDTAAAIEAGLNNKDAVSVLEITLASGEITNIVCKSTEKGLREALRRSPMAEIKAVNKTIADLSALRAERKQAALEEAIPGLGALTALRDRAMADSERARAAFERMMDSGSGIAPKPADATLRDEYEAALAANPRAALYLRAEAQRDSAHWADNTGKGEAGKTAMAILRRGGSLEEAEAALAKRREIVD
jgi:hypothetical protein